MITLADSIIIPKTCFIFENNDFYRGRHSEAEMYSGIGFEESYNFETWIGINLIPL